MTQYMLLNFSSLNIEKYYPFLIIQILTKCFNIIYILIEKKKKHSHLEYTDCIPSKEVRTLPPYPHCQKRVSWVRYLTTSHGRAPVLEIWEGWSTPTLPLLLVQVPSKGQIDLFKNYLYLIGPCAKKKEHFQETIT